MVGTIFVVVRMQGDWTGTAFTPNYLRGIGSAGLPTGPTVGNPHVFITQDVDNIRNLTDMEVRTTCCCRLICNTATTAVVAGRFI